MMLFEVEDRLVAVNADANQGFVWNADAGEWRTVADYVARKAWAEGVGLTAAQAKKRFPAADLQAIPAFA